MRDTNSRRVAKNRKCIDCGGVLVEGPHGGLSVNWNCSRCGAGFNDMGPFGVERIRRAELAEATKRKRTPTTKEPR